MTATQAQAIVDAFRVANITNANLTYLTQHYLYRVTSTEGLRAILTAPQKTYLNTLTSVGAQPFV